MSGRSKHITQDGLPDIVFRLAAGILGGYFVMLVFTALLGFAFGLTGAPRSEGIMMGVVVSFFSYPAIILWMVATSKPLKHGLWLFATAFTVYVGIVFVLAGLG